MARSVPGMGRGGPVRADGRTNDPTVLPGEGLTLQVGKRRHPEGHRRQEYGGLGRRRYGPSVGAISKPEFCPYGDCHSPDVQLERGEVQIDAADPERRLAHGRDFATQWVWVCGACGRRLGLAPAPSDQGARET